MMKRLSVILASAALLCCFCSNPTGNSAANDMDYFIKFSCHQKTYAVGKKQNGEWYTEPQSSHIDQIELGKVASGINDTSYSMNAMTNGISIGITFPRQNKPVTFQMHKNNQNSGYFQCFYSESISCYYATPDKYNSSDTSSAIIGELTIVKIDTLWRRMEGSFKFTLYKYIVDLQTSTVKAANDSLSISDGSFLYRY